ncbi:MarR family winged helix-turn-helix transcriptional regulator [Paracoccus aerodenitrificans]|uniref:MarR family winged helix-turn-helix transcriptional regulator n=1 Tax=Paracoccus aerodenitrificans TaxID=3017781 RepID=UPI0022F1005F|nr:MarR family transcriptional regulator [Paracoccus aerodenitrificans]WBU64267.1 MarR family transcriptional regulator [Paracoccus aerodenitrificans]
MQGAAPTRRLWDRPTWLLNHLAGTGRRVLGDRIGSAFERNKYGILAGLADEGAASQSVLSQRTGQDRGDLVAMLNKLEAEGLVIRRPDPSDRRNKRVEMTEQGRSELKSLDKLVAEAQDILLAPLTQDERAEFLRMMKSLLIHHENYREPS